MRKYQLRALEGDAGVMPSLSEAEQEGSGAGIWSWFRKNCPRLGCMSDGHPDVKIENGNTLETQKTPLRTESLPVKELIG
jgi:hypothetical protein